MIWLLLAGLCVLVEMWNLSARPDDTRASGIPLLLALLFGALWWLTQGG